MKAKLLSAPGQRFVYFPKYSAGIFILGFALLSGIYNYHEILFLPPQSIHLWRQCDCLSQAMNYFQDGNPFFMPALHNLGQDGTGRAVSDFPLIYYLTAKIWQVSGPEESVMRILNFSIFISALFVLFKTIERILCDSYLALFIVFLLFSSPFLVYYANNFLMDVPAFSLALIGMCFFERFYFIGKTKYLYLFALFFALAGLFKISALLGFFTVLTIYILELLGVKVRLTSKVFDKPRIQLIPFVLVLAVQLIWYSYVLHYNASYNSGLFLTQVIPIWALDSLDIQSVVHHLGDQFRWNYFRPEILILILLFWILYMLFAPRYTRTFFWINLILPTGILAFGLLFFALLKEHDYYMINALIIIPIILVSFALMLKLRWSALYRSIVFRVLLAIILVHSIDFARRRIHERYAADSWQNQSYISNKQVLRQLPEYFSAIGVKPDALVISLPDPSVDVSLYMMNHKGWTNYNINRDAGKIREKIAMGAEFLIISDSTLLELPFMKPFIHNKIGQLEHISIFKIKNSP